MSNIEERLTAIEHKLGIIPTWEQIDAWYKEGLLQVYCPQLDPTVALYDDGGLWFNWSCVHPENEFASPSANYSFYREKSRPYHPSRFRRDPDFVSKDPYAEAKQAFKDGCLQYGSDVTGWKDYVCVQEPLWSCEPPSYFRRKPEEKKSKHDPFIFNGGWLDSESACNREIDLMIGAVTHFNPYYKAERSVMKSSSGCYEYSLTITVSE